MGKRATGEKPGVCDSADEVESVAPVAVELEGGRVCRFSVADELSIPSGAGGMSREAREAAARYGFWATQTERALRRVRDRERRLRELRAEVYFSVRVTLERDTDFDHVSEAMVEAGVGVVPKVRTLDKSLDSARARYGQCRAMRDGWDVKCRMLARLIGQPMRDRE